MLRLMLDACYAAFFAPLRALRHVAYDDMTRSY